MYICGGMQAADNYPRNQVIFRSRIGETGDKYTILFQVAAQPVLSSIKNRVMGKIFKQI
jgi:hypothetical protein